MKNALFEKRSRIEAPVEAVFQWHARPGAIERYSPPWDPIKVIRRSGGIKTGAKVAIRMKAGPVPYIWKARHTDFQENRLFRDEQISGPFSEWIHSHHFEADGPDACYVTDSISYRLPPHPFRQVLSYRMVENKLARIFNYRHFTLKHDLRVQLGYPSDPPLSILVTGSSGLIGSALVPFLTTAGHKVLKMVRRPPQSSDEIFWNPASKDLNPSDLEGIDAVVHLAGESIGMGRWTQKKRDKILSSRIDGTRLLVNTLKAMPHPPGVLLSASAIGYYGDRGDQVLNDSEQSGHDFVSDVCKRWEDEAIEAESVGIRTALLRIGVVLDQGGGALKELLPAYRLGIIPKIYSGSQYVSWIGLNDTVDAIYHLIMSPGIKGPVNIVAPHPVTSDQLAQQLASTIGSKLGIRLSRRVIKGMFGQKGEEILLSSTRVIPEKLQQSDFVYRHDHLALLLQTIFGLEKEGKG